MKILYLVSTLAFVVWTKNLVLHEKSVRSFSIESQTSTITLSSVSDLPEPIQSGGLVFSFVDIPATAYTQQLAVKSDVAYARLANLPTDGQHRLPEPVAASLIQHHQLPIQRRDSCWMISLGNGKTTSLCDNAGKKAYDNYIRYQLIDYHQPVGFYQFVVSHYEDRENILVNAVTGEKFRVWDYAFLSPDGQRFFVCSYDLEAGFAPNGLQVWKVKGTKLMKEFELQVPNWGPVEPVWLNGKELLFKRVYLDTETGTEQVKYAKMTIR